MVLHHSCSAFIPHNRFRLVVLSGDIQEWYVHLKNDSLIGSYSGILDIPFVTWLIFNNDSEIEEDIPLNIDLAR